MNCSSVRKKLNRYLDDELEGPEREAVCDHLAECPDCSLTYEELKQLNEDLESALVTGEEPSDKFTRNLLNRAEQEFSGRVTNDHNDDKKSGFSTRRAGSMVAGLTLVLVLFMSVYLGFGVLEQRTPSASDRVVAEESSPERSTTDDTTTRIPEAIDVPPASFEAVSFRDPYREVSVLEASQRP